jgi:hydrogenase/urease accessory protein HupE
MSNDKDQPSSTGCFISGASLLIAYFELDFFGECVMLASRIGYGLVVATLGLLGFGCGVALGIHFSAKATAWSYRLIFGLIGMAIPTVIIYFILGAGLR